jgi:hypothetical protein
MPAVSHKTASVPARAIGAAFIGESNRIER